MFLLRLERHFLSVTLQDPEEASGTCVVGVCPSHHTAVTALINWINAGTFL